MVLTYSKQVPLGDPAPEFTLPEPLTGLNHSLTGCSGSSGTLVMFICNHCPFVIHIRDELVRIAKDYMDAGIGMVAINSNDVINYPADSPAKMAEHASKYAYPFPYLFDESQEVALAYHAVCTPDFFLFDATLKLVYRGQLDESTPGNNQPVTGQALRSAMDALILGHPIPSKQNPSMGCNIKWKK